MIVGSADLFLVSSTIATCLEVENQFLPPIGSRDLASGL